jgi:drug/metabolite transporter (DMT)-like permease
MNENHRFFSIGIFVVLTLIWGTSFILIKRGLAVYSPAEVASLRVTAASLFLLPFALRSLPSLRTSHYPKLVGVGMMGIFIPAFLFSMAQTRLDSSVAGILNSLTPLFTLLMGVFLFSQRFRGGSVIGVILGFGGTALLILSRSGGQAAGINWYALLIVVSCILYGTNLNLIKFKLPDLRSVAITSVALLLIGPLAIIYLFAFTGFTHKLTHAPGAVEAMLYIVLLGVMSTSIATVLFNRLVKISTPLFASSVTYFMPIVAVLWGVLDGERLTAGHYAGMALIIGGVYIANLSPRYVPSKDEKPTA